MKDCAFPWAWIEPSSMSGARCGQINHKKTTLQTSKLLGPARVDESTGVVIVDAKFCTLAELAEADCLSSTSSHRFIGPRFSSLILDSIDNSQFQLFPITVVAKDGLCRDFSSVVPLNELTCTVPSKSKINSWMEVGVFTTDYDFLYFGPCCMCDLDIALDSMTFLTLVSDRFKELIDANGIRGANFLRAEEVSTFE